MWVYFVVVLLFILSFTASPENKVLIPLYRLLNYWMSKETSIPKVERALFFFTCIIGFSSETWSCLYIEVN